MSSRHLKQIKEARRVYSKWFHFDSEDIVEHPFPFKMNGNTLVLVHLGSVARIDYDSDKFDGKFKGYTHNFKKKPFLYTTYNGKVLIISPVRLTSAGIED